MAKFLATVSLLLCGCAGTAHLTPSSDPLQDSDANRYFRGTLRLVGNYQVDETGDICFAPNPRSRKMLRFVPGNNVVCFANESEAIQLLGIEKEIQKIDTQTICGTEGFAAIRVSNLWIGEGPARTWYTTHLDSVVTLEAPRMIRCDG